MGRVRVFPGLQGRYYHLDCDLFLSLKMRLRPKGADPNHQGGGGAVNVQQELTDHRLLGGQKFEDHLITTHMKDTVRRVPFTSDAQTELGGCATPLARLAGLANEDAKLDVMTTLYALMSAPVGTYVYQACFEPPESIVRDMGITNARFRLSRCYTDFLLIVDAPDGQRQIKIIDAKNSAGVSHTHQLQVAFYAVVIKHVLAEQSKFFAGLKKLSVHPVGAIWLRGSAEPVDFRLDMPELFIDMFLRGKLQDGVLRQEFGQLRWGLESGCSGCEFQQGCQSRAKEERCVSLVPGTPRRFKYLADQHAGASGGQTLYDIEETGAMLKLQEKHADDWPRYAFADLSAWRVRHHALSTSTLLPTGTTSATLPAGEDAAVVLAIITDSVTGDIAAFAVSTLNIRARPDLPTHMIPPVSAAKAFDPAVADNTPFHQSPLALQLIDALKAHLDECETRGLKAHVYTFDSKERTVLTQLLITIALDDENVPAETARRAYVLYMTLCGDEECLRLADDTPLPDRLQGSQQQITVLAYEIQTLLAFPPGGGASEFGKCWKHLFRPSPEHNDWYASSCYNDGSADHILFMWLTGGDIAELCASRTVAAGAILGALRTSEFALDGGSAGTLEKLALLGKRVAAFKVAEPIILPSNLLQKMVFTSQLQVVETCSQARQHRLLPRSNRDFAGHAITATVIAAPVGSSEFDAAVDSEQKNMRSALVWAEVKVGGGSGLAIKPTDFPEFLLTADTAAGDQKQKQFDDIRHFNESARVGPQPCFVALPHTLVLRIPGTQRMRTVIGFRPFSWNSLGEWGKVRDQAGGFLSVGSRVLLQKRCHDMQYAKLCEHHGGINPHDPPFKLFEAIVRNRGVDPANIPASDRALGDLFTTLVARSLGDRVAWPANALSASQHGVLSKVATTRSPVSVVWGPPGTGKTHFLGLLILYLLLDAAERPRDVPSVRILVCAQNHHAIENVINAVVRLKESHPGAERLRAEKRNFVVAKIGGEGANVGYTRVKSSPKPIKTFFNKTESCVVGATVWAVKKMPDDVRFDLVILDEASQVVVSDAAIPILRVSARAGSRVILAGDHKQLPPIASVDYSRLSADLGVRPRVWASIFECVMEQSNDDAAVWKYDEVVGTMLENRRMSAALCQLPIGAGMYGAGYRPGTDEVARRHFVLHAPVASISLHAGGPASTYTPVDPRAIQALLPDERLRGLCKKVFEWPGSTVVVRLGGKHGPACLETEAAAVAYLATFLRLHLPDPDPARAGQFAPLEDAGADGGFWAERLKIVTPHHAQRLKITAQLRGAWGRPADAPVQIETVEKIQGREADVVISCFGYNDQEQLSQELGFVYDPRRINVSVTRARRKNIVIVGDATLFSPTPALLEDEATVEGFNYLCQVLRRAEAERPGARDFMRGLALSTDDALVVRVPRAAAAATK